MYIKGIDSIKGVLILFVILGHLLLGSLDSNIWRYMIYSFHMPLFIAISGYLSNYNKVRSYSLKTIVDKYFPRLILPWLIAVVIYCIVVKGSINIVQLFNAIIQPYYHLWYVPSFLLYVILFRVLLGFNKNPFVVLVIAFIIGISTQLITTNIHIDLIKKITHVFRLQFFPFFVLGSYLNQNIQQKNTTKYYLILGGAAIVTLLSFWYANNIIKFSNFFVFNSLLAFVVITLIKANKFPAPKTLVWSGQNSLAIYLYHMIPIILVHRYTFNHLRYYLLSCILLIVLLFFIKQLSRIIWINKILFGVK